MWNSTNKYGYPGKEMFPVSSERLPMPSVEVFQWLSSSTIPRRVCVRSSSILLRPNKWRGWVARVCLLQCHEVVPIICLFFFRCLVAQTLSAGWPACLPDCLLTWSPSMVTVWHGYCPVHLLDPWYFCRGIRQYPSHVMSALAELSQILTNVSYWMLLPGSALLAHG